MTNALLIAKRTEKTNQIENLLSEYFQKVSVISDLTGSGQLPLQYHFDLIVVTDSLEIKPDGDFISCLRRLFPGAKFLHLGNEIAPQTEMSLRAAGLIFLGSYDLFIHCAHQILGAVADSVKKEAHTLVG
jgi:hypothetical protein